MLFVEQAYYAAVKVVLAERLLVVSLEIHSNAVGRNALAHQVVLYLVGAALGKIQVDFLVTRLYIGVAGDSNIYILVVTEQLQRKNGCKTDSFCTRLGEKGGFGGEMAPTGPRM